MDRELGNPTDELLALGRPHPVEANIHPVDRERPTRRFGRYNYLIGLAVAVTAVIGALTAAVLTEKRLFVSGNGELFAMLTFVGLMILGGALVTVGGVERNMRHHRAAVRQALLGNSHVGEQVDRLMEAVAPLCERLAALEQKMEEVGQKVSERPSYGDGVIDGIQMRTDALESPE